MLPYEKLQRKTLNIHEVNLRTQTGNLLLRKYGLISSKRGIHKRKKWLAQSRLPTKEGRVGYHSL